MACHRKHRISMGVERTIAVKRSRNSLSSASIPGTQIHHPVPLAYRNPRCMAQECQGAVVRMREIEIFVICGDTYQ
jgi:hypothetical protein